jgi:hypothetical protein
MNAQKLIDYVTKKTGDALTVESESQAGINENA